MLCALCVRVAFPGLVVGVFVSLVFVLACVLQCCSLAVPVWLLAVWCCCVFLGAGWVGVCCAVAALGWGSGVLLCVCSALCAGVPLSACFLVCESDSFCSPGSEWPLSRVLDVGLRCGAVRVAARFFSFRLLVFLFSAPFGGLRSAGVRVLLRCPSVSCVCCASCARVAVRCRGSPAWRRGRWWRCALWLLLRAAP